VHFTDPELSTDAALVLRDMLLRYGFTSVVDTGSVLSDTQRLAAAIEAGRLEGPRIITASGSLVYTDGTPSYLPGIKLPEVASAAAATPMVNSVLDAGADGIKIFSGSFQASRPTVLLPPDVIAAITAAAHARGSFVVSHPTDLPGLMNAVQNGVDVLAHTAPAAGALGPEVIDTMLAAGVALIPTLKLWSWELGRGGAPEAALRAFQNAGVDQLRAYSAAGGEILLGTDVGYMRDYDTTEELEMMRRAGLTFRDILASLTTNPARRFAAESGVVEPGAPGDLVIFAADPTDDPTVLSNVRYTVRGGRIAYDALR
jgi:imidazolonepropionase-like amidohydrolase